MSCGATCDLADGTLTCTLDAGHDGPTHSDDGHEWGDPALPNPAHRDPE